MPGEHPRQRRRRWIGRHQLDRSVGREAFLFERTGVVRDPGVVRPAERRPCRVQPVVGFHRRRCELVRPPRLPGEARHHRRPHADVGAFARVEPLAARGCQRQRPLIGARRLLPRVGGTRGSSGLDPGRQRAGPVAGLGPVMGELRRGSGRRLGAQLGSRRERRREPAVQADPLGREQVVTHRLGQQGMAEPIPAAVGGRFDHVLGGRFPEPGREIGGLERDDRCEQLRVHVPPDDRRPGEHLQGRVRQPGQPGCQEVAEGRRQPARVEVERGELLDVERVPVGELDDPRDAGRFERPARDRLELGRDVFWRQRIEPEVREAPRVLELDQHGSQGMPPMELVGSVGADEDHARVTEPRRHEGQQLERGPVRPMEVVDDEHEIRGRGRVDDGITEGEEGSRPRRRRRAVTARSGQVGAHPREHVRRRSCRDQAVEQVQDRQEWEGSGGELGAGAVDHQQPTGPPTEIRRQRPRTPRAAVSSRCPPRHRPARRVRAVVRHRQAPAAARRAAFDGRRRSGWTLARACRHAGTSRQVGVSSWRRSSRPCP